MLQNKFTSAYVKLFLIFIVIPVLAILFVLNRAYSKTLIKSYALSQAQIIEKTKISIENELRGQAIAALNVGVNYELLDLANRWHRETEIPLKSMFGMSIHSKLSQPVLHMNEYENISIYFKNSDVVYSYGQALETLKHDVNAKDWYRRALNNSGSLIVDNSMREKNGRHIVAYAISPSIFLHDNDVEVIYFSFYADFVKNYNLHTDNTIIIDKFGNILYKSHDNVFDISQYDLTNFGLNSSIEVVNGTRMLVTSEIIPMSDWRIIQFRPYSQILNEVREITIYGYMTISLFLVLFILFSVMFYKKIVKPVLELEMQALQYQITPHFIINTLNSIKIMALISKQENILKMSGAFMRHLSAVIGRNSSFVQIKEEIENIKSYIHIMQIRFGDTFEVEYDIDESIKDLFILSFLLQPIVENSIIHGFAEKDFNGVIHIKGFRQNNNIVFEVFDNGVGISEEKAKILLSKKKKHRKGILSMGLYNIDKRIKLNYGHSYGLHIKSVIGEYTNIKFELPLRACSYYSCSDLKTAQ